MNANQLYEFFTSDVFCGKLKKIAGHAIHTGRRSACDINKKDNELEYVKMFHEFEDFKVNASEGYKSIIRVDIYPKENQFYIPTQESFEYIEHPGDRILLSGHADKEMNIEVLAMRNTFEQNYEYIMNLLEDKLTKLPDVTEADRILEQQGIHVRRFNYKREGNRLVIADSNKYLFNKF